MGLGDLTPDSGESSSSGQSTHIKYWNPRAASDKISDGTEERYKQEYYDAVQELRQMVGQNLNIPIGKFAHALVEAEKRDDYGPLFDLFVTLGPDNEEEFVAALQERL